MEKIKNLMYLPKSINKEITFMLYNFKNFEKLIENREEDLIDSIKVTNVAYLKAINKSNNTLEDMIIRFDNDKIIKRYQRWKQLINLYINKLYNLLAGFIIFYKKIIEK